MATEYLIHSGHDKIGMIVGAREVYTCRKRIEGYKEALAFITFLLRKNIFSMGNIKDRRDMKE